MAYKILINNSEKDLLVYLLTRKGDDPKHDGPEVEVRLPKGKTERVAYGDDHNPYLNGLALKWEDSISIGKITQRVPPGHRGSDWDDTLNTNDTLTIKHAGMEVVGSNS